MDNPKIKNHQEIQGYLLYRIVIIANALCPKSSSPCQLIGADGFVKSNRLELEGLPINSLRVKSTHSLNVNLPDQMNQVSDLITLLLRYLLHPHVNDRFRIFFGERRNEKTAAALQYELAADGN